MRIRLKVSRQGLPAVSLLWNIPQDTSLETATISRLIEQVNDVVPLEAADWGLEDYVVKIDNFECLHFSLLKDVLKDDDAVSIRPIETAELRQRNIGGRSQISESGVHLYDGVPFGRQPLRKLARPPIYIPPRKSNRATYEEDGDVDEPVGLLESDVAPLNHQAGLSGFLKDRAVPAMNQRRSGHSSPSQKSVRFEDEATNGNVDLMDEDEDEDSDEDFQAASETSSSEGTSDEEDEVQQPPQKRQKTTATPNESNQQVGSSSNNEEPDEDNEGPEAYPFRKSGIPYEGLSRTKKRNLRRRERKKLDKLKSVGLLPVNAQLKDRRELLLKGGSDIPVETAVKGLRGGDASASDEESTSGESSSDESDDTSDEDPSDEDSVSSDEAANLEAPKVQGQTQNLAEFAKRRQALVDAITSGGVDVEDEGLASKTVERTAKKTDQQPAEAEPGEDYQDTTIVKAVAPTSDGQTLQPLAKRARLDVGSSRRMLFGSLGLRTPKTKEDEDKLRSKLKDAAKPKGRKKPVTATSEAVEDAEKEVTPDSDAWKGRIRLTAVECMDENVQLSEPPYPFKQRWDPQQQAGLEPKIYSRGLNAKQKRKRKRTAAEQYQYGRHGYLEDDSNYAVYDDEYDDPGNQYDDAKGQNIPLDYGDEDGTEFNGFSEAVSPGNGADAQIRCEMSSNESRTLSKPSDPEPEDHLPAVPDDPSSLPDLTPDTDIQPGDHIMFKQLECDEATNWQPTISPYRTATVISVDEASLKVSLSAKDQPQKRKYDEDGNRIYGKFEMVALADEEDEEDDGIRWIDRSDLLEPKMLPPPPAWENPMLLELMTLTQGQSTSPAADNAVASGENTTAGAAHAAGSDADKTATSGKDTKGSKMEVIEVSSDSSDTDSSDEGPEVLNAKGSSPSPELGNEMEVDGGSLLPAAVQASA